MKGRRGFTLLEVMVAIAILGLSLTVILSAQAGLYASGASAQKMSVAIGLVRCKMSELEEKQLKLGFPAADEDDDGQCCEDDDRQDMHCSWKIEKVQLPPVQMTSSMGGPSGSASPASSALDLIGNLASAGKGGSAAGGALAGGALAGGALAGGAGAAGGLGALGGLLSLSSSDSTPGDGGLHKLATDITEGTGGPGGIASALAPLVMGFVYPQLKPLLETSISKVTVKIEWKEGIRSRDFSIVQYMTRPMFPPPDLPGAGTTGGSTAGGAIGGLIGGGASPIGGGASPIGGLFGGAR